jgi:CRISPR system Cascade subunit CasD
MKEFLILRFDAPLMSFGGPIIDHFGIIQEFPALSMLTGLLANSLGYHHAEATLLGRLQDRLRYAVRCDRQGTTAQDFQTVDLGQDFLQKTGWTSRGVPEGRGSGEATRGTHIRYRDFRCDAVFSLALFLDPANEPPTLDDLEKALKNPFRPLFIGRKPCLPATPILQGRFKAESLVNALELIPRLTGYRRDMADEFLPAWWPAHEGDPPDSVLMEVTDERDWANQIHVGRRMVRRGRVKPKEATHEPE